MQLKIERRIKTTGEERGKAPTITTLLAHQKNNKERKHTEKYNTKKNLRVEERKMT